MAMGLSLGRFSCQFATVFIILVFMEPDYFGSLALSFQFGKNIPLRKERLCIGADTQ